MAGKTQFSNGGANDRAIMNRFYEFVAPNGYRPHGNVFYVSSVTGSSTGPGWGVSNAYATIQQAMAQCVADNDDWIVVLPGHAETIVAASGIDYLVSGVTIQGIGNSATRPTVTFGTATTATIDFSAANGVLRNIRCVNNIDNLAAFIEGGADNALIEGCSFINGTSKEYLTAITVPTTFDNWVIRGNTFIQSSDPAGMNAAAGTGCIYIVDSENVLIEDNEFRGNFETAFIHNKTTAAVNLWTRNNRGICSLADAQPFLLVTTATGGSIRDSFITPAETQVTEATLSGTFGAGFFNFQTFYGNDGGGGQLAVAGQAAAS